MNPTPFGPITLAHGRGAGPTPLAHAGIGWVQDAATGAGLFVELHGDDRAKLDAELRITLDSMQRQRGIDFGAVHTEIASVACEDEPVCALVIAVYAAAPW